MPVKYVFRLRRGNASEWTNVNPILALGEPGIEMDTQKFKIGDGTTAWNNLGYMDELVDDVDVVFTDNVTGDVSITKHGYAPKAPNDTSKFLRGDATWSPVSVTGTTVLDSNVIFSDIVTGDVSTSKHGYTPKAPNDTSKFLRGDATWAPATVTGVNDVNVVFTDNTTGDVSTSKHGFAPKAPGDTTEFLRGDATWAVPTVSGGGGNYTLLSDTVLSGNAANIDLTSISGAYKHLELIMHLRTDQAVATSGFTIRVNNDSSGSYDDQYAQGNNTSSDINADSAVSAWTETNCPGSSGSSGEFAIYRILLADYANTTTHKHFIGNYSYFATLGTKSSYHVFNLGGAWRSNTAINRITLIPNSSSNFVSGCRVSLYGLS